MLKRIEASQVQAGMFIEAIEGTWQDKVLRKHRFLLRGEANVQKLRSSKANSVIINTAKGIDIPTAPPSGPGAADPDPAGHQALDVSAALQTVRQSSQLLGNLFKTALAGGAVTFDETAPIVKDISKSIDNNPSVFVSVTRLKLKDEATFIHSISVSALLIHFGRYLGFNAAAVEMLGVGGLLHDIGKVDVPATILNKEGHLDESEMRLMRCHPLTGHRILSRQPGMPDMVLDICRHHHERIDGKGYPEKLSGADFSIHARMAAICDVYDAITSARPYKKPWSAAEALGWMLKREGQFDRRLLKKFSLCLSLT